MHIRDPDTGELIDLFSTPELEADLQKNSAHQHCEHKNKELRQVIRNEKVIRIAMQCIGCGEQIGNAVKKSEAPPNLPIFDDVLSERIRQERITNRDRIYFKHLALQKNRAASNQIEYDAYLASPEWAEKRKKVLKRAGGVCEGCLEAAATEVHHLTYDHIYNEFMFELLALCHDCHKRIHANLDDEQDASLEDEQTSIDEYTEPLCSGCRWFDGDKDCMKFELPISDAMVEGGPCGPDQSAKEPLK